MSARQLSPERRDGAGARLLQRVIRIISNVPQMLPVFTQYQTLHCIAAIDVQGQKATFPIAS